LSIGIIFAHYKTKRDDIISSSSTFIIYFIKIGDTKMGAAGNKKPKKPGKKKGPSYEEEEKVIPLKNKKK